MTSPAPLIEPASLDPDEKATALVEALARSHDLPATS
jgi:hypothetical protein